MVEHFSTKQRHYARKGLALKRAAAEGEERAARVAAWEALYPSRAGKEFLHRLAERYEGVANLVNDVRRAPEMNRHVRESAVRGKITRFLKASSGIHNLHNHTLPVAAAIAGLFDENAEDFFREIAAVKPVKGHIRYANMHPALRSSARNNVLRRMLRRHGKAPLL